MKKVIIANSWDTFSPIMDGDVLIDGQKVSIEPTELLSTIGHAVSMTTLSFDSFNALPADRMLSLDGYPDLAFTVDEQEAYVILRPVWPI